MLRVMLRLGKTEVDTQHYGRAMAWKGTAHNAHFGGLCSKLCDAAGYPPKRKGEYYVEAIQQGAVMVDVTAYLRHREKALE
jgi:hypothetical protein